MLDATRKLFAAREDFVRYRFNEGRQIAKQVRGYRGPSAAQIEAMRFARDEAITVDQRITEVLAGILRRAAPAIADAFDRHLVPVAERAFRNWPVDTGLSKSLLAYRYEPQSDGGIAAVYACDAHHARFIRFSKRRRKGEPNPAPGRVVWTELVGKPVKRVALDKLRRDIARSVSNGA